MNTVYRLYIGLPGNSQEQERHKASILARAAANFPSFTGHDAQGFYQGKELATIVLVIACDQYESVFSLAQDLLVITGQHAVGIEHHGQYRSLNADSRFEQYAAQQSEVAA